MSAIHVFRFVCVSLSVVLLLLMIDRLVLPCRITVKFVVHGFRWNFDDYLDGLTREAPCWSISGMFARIYQWHVRAHTHTHANCSCLLRPFTEQAGVGAHSSQESSWPIAKVL